VAYGVLALLAAWYFIVRHGSAAGVIVGCALAIQGTGETVDLLATRGYSLLPSRSGYDEVHRMMWTLDELRPAEPE